MGLRKHQFKEIIKNFKTMTESSRPFWVRGPVGLHRLHTHDTCHGGPLLSTVEPTLGGQQSREKSFGWGVRRCALAPVVPLVLMGP